MLAQSGVIRVAVPDFRKPVEKYLKEGDADSFMEEIATCPIRRRSRHPLILIRQQMTHSVHRWMYDEVTLRNRLGAVGFKGVERRSSYDSHILDIRLVEDPSRVDDGPCLEGVR